MTRSKRVDREGLARFLRARRDALQPEDVGLPRGPRRRTTGLRREEVAAISGLSSDYYTRIEQLRGPVPSAQILSAIAQGLRLTTDERERLFDLAGHATPQHRTWNNHVNAGIMRVLDRLDDTPAQVESILGETLKQTKLAVALLGDETAYTGLERSRIYRWFVDLHARERFLEEDHAAHSRHLVAQLASAYAKTNGETPATKMVDQLRRRSNEFAQLWVQQPVVGPYCEPKRIRHPRLGLVELYGQTLLDPDQSQTLVIFTAAPGSESHEKLQRLAEDRSYGHRS